MPQKSHTNCARATNLQRGKRYPSQPTFEEVEDEDFPDPDSKSHNCHNASQPRHDDIIDDEEFLNIIGCLRRTAMVDDEVESKSESDDEGKEKRGGNSLRTYKEYPHWNNFWMHCRRHMTLHLQRNENEKGVKRG